MLELGQPMHAFDRDAVTGPITVRLAPRGREAHHPGRRRRGSSTADDLLITDDTGPIGLAAVMGGASTEIGDGTTTVLLEAAHWEPTGVARTARRHRLPSEAAKRFERGVDPEMTVVALARAAELLAEYGGARVVGGVVDVDTRGPAAGHRARRRPSPPAWPGCAYTAAQVVELLERRRLRRSTPTATRSPVTPPSWRPDLTDPADLVEEVVRLAGYDDVPSVLPTAPPGRGLTDVQRRRRSVGRTLAEAGYVEAPSYPFVGTAALDALGLPADDAAPRRSSSCATRCRRRSRRCARRCCPACSPRWPATSPAASATSRCSSTARCSPAAGARRRRCPASTAVRTTRRSPRCSARCRRSRGTSPWR